MDKAPYRERKTQSQILPQRQLLPQRRDQGLDGLVYYARDTLRPALCRDPIPQVFLMREGRREIGEEECSVKCQHQGEGRGKGENGKEGKGVNYVNNAWTISPASLTTATDWPA